MAAWINGIVERFQRDPHTRVSGSRLTNHPGQDAPGQLSPRQAPHLLAHCLAMSLWRAVKRVAAAEQFSRSMSTSSTHALISVTVSC